MIIAKNTSIVYSVAASINGIMLTIDNKIDGNINTLTLPVNAQHYKEGVVLSFDDYDDIFFKCEKAIKISYNESKEVAILVVLFDRENDKKLCQSYISNLDNIKNNHE